MAEDGSETPGFGPDDVLRWQEEERARRAGENKKKGKKRPTEHVDWATRRREEISRKRKDTIERDANKPLPAGNYLSGERPDHPDDVELPSDEGKD